MTKQARSKQAATPATPATPRKKAPVPKPAASSKRDGSRSDPARERQSVPFEPIRQPRAHDYVYEQLARHIGLGLIGAGEPLPPERNLAALFGVGRTTIQRAIQMLEEEHLVETRRGRLGGTFVLGTRSDEVGHRRLLNNLRAAADEIRDALVLRKITEEATARIAADEATDAEIREMEASLDRMDAAASELDYHRYDTDFHLQIARASHNALLYESAERARLLLNNAILALPETSAWHARIQKEHRALVDAIRRGDGDEAQAIIADHLDHTDTSVRAMLFAL